MGNLLTFFELIATALWFGGSVTGGASATRLRALFFACAGVLAAVSAARGFLWIWTPVQGATLVLVVLAALAVRWWARVPGIVFGVLYISWIAWRGY